MLMHNSVHVLGILGKDPDYEGGCFVLTVDTTRLAPRVDKTRLETSPEEASTPHRIVTDRLRVRVPPFLADTAAGLKRGARLFVDGTLESRMHIDPATGRALHVMSIAARRLEVFQDGVRQDIFRALRRKQQRDWEAEAFIHAVTGHG
jgi:hypothetical protein